MKAYMLLLLLHTTNCFLLTRINYLSLSKSSRNDGLYMTKNEVKKEEENYIKGTKIVRGKGESTLAFVKGRRQSKEISDYLSSTSTKQEKSTRSKKAIWYDSESAQSVGFNGWEVHYAALLHHLKVYGHANVPQKERYECVLTNVGAVGKSFHYAANLGQWLNTQRKGKAGTHRSYRLGGVREQLLQLLVDQNTLLWDASEFKATVKLKRQSDDEWPLHYAALLQFQAEFGTCNVPKGFVYKCRINQNLDINDETTRTYFEYEGQLGLWLQRQRQAKKGTSKSYKLTSDREAQLQVIVDQGHLLWDASEMNSCVERKVLGDNMWPLHYAALLAFGRENGHCNVQNNQRDYEYVLYVPKIDNSSADSASVEMVSYKGRLGEWLCRQMTLFRQGKLTSERAALIQELLSKDMLQWKLRSSIVMKPLLTKRKNRAVKSSSTSTE